MEDNALYVSLHGVASVEQLDGAIFLACTPLLGWKSTKLAGTIAKGGAKYCGIDIDIKLKEFLPKVANKILIFDDLERTSIPIDQALGHINNFVEHGECKVIVIANEAEIHRKHKKKYRSQKEKVIGKTLYIEEDTHGALVHFISDLTDGDAKEFIERQRSEIRSLFAQFLIPNLRILRHSILDFKRFYDLLSKQHQENEEACKLLLHMLLPLSFEVKMGRLRQEEIHERSTMRLR
jgi:hypothetical protein